MKSITKEIQKKIFEYYGVGGSVNVYATSDGGRFPYENTGLKPLVPNQINTKTSYVNDWEKVSSNNDVYRFPIKQFTLGIRIEKGRNTEFSVFDIAQIVLNNLKKDAQFYDKIKNEIEK